jgi:hypothetical protein
LGLVRERHLLRRRQGIGPAVQADAQSDIAGLPFLRLLDELPRVTARKCKPRGVLPSYMLDFFMTCSNRF